MIPFDYITEWRAEPQRIVAAFLDYMVRDGHPITRAQVEQNLALKMRDGAFLADLSPLLATGEEWDPMLPRYSFQRAWSRSFQAIRGRVTTAE